MKIADIMARTNWALLAQQKLALLAVLREDREDAALEERLEGILNWIDAIQDAAEADGYAVVWLKGGK